MSSYVQLGPGLGSRLTVPTFRRRPRERRGLLSAALLAALLASGFWIGAQMDEGRATGAQIQAAQSEVVQ